jgi:hypothetical protein
MTLIRLILLVMLPRKSRVRLTRQLEEDLNVPDEASKNVKKFGWRLFF